MSLKKQAIINTVGMIVYLFAIWLLTVSTSQLLNYESVGRLTLAMAIGNIILTVQMYGTRSFQSSDVGFQYTSKDYLYSRAITVVCGWLIGGAICAVLGYPVSTKLTIAYYILIKTSESISDVLFGNDQRFGHLELAGFSMMIRGVVLLLLFLLGIVTFHSLNAGLAAAAVGVLAITFFVDFPLHNKTVEEHKAPKNSGGSRDIMKACFPLLLASLIPTVITAFPRIILERFYGTELLGYYGNVSTPALILTTVAPTILTALLPDYGRAVNDKNRKRIIKLWTGSILGSVAAMLVCMLAVEMFGRPVMAFIYTEAILPYVHLLNYVLLAMLLYVISMCCNTALIPMRKNWGLVVTSLSALGVCLISSVPMIRRWGMGGAVTVLLVSYGVQAIIQIIWLIHICFFKYRERA